MIEKLEHKNEAVSRQIFRVFQRAYQQEAQLIGVADFPPLRRWVKDIERTNSEFYGIKRHEVLAAVIEIEVTKQQLDIHSLTVDPEYVRRGLADQLIRYVLAQMDCSQAIVETAVANSPAINLYKKHGFVEYKRWVPSHGIPKLALSVKWAVDTVN
nr:GNAT family N-acetyltransferase [uncultured Shewanella sp.]